MYKKGELEQEKLDRLVEIGWEPFVGIGIGSIEDDKRWELMLDRLIKFKNERGHCKVPHSFADDPVRRHRLGRVSQERVDKLTFLGFQFDANERETKRKSTWEVS